MKCLFIDFRIGKQLVGDKYEDCWWHFDASKEKQKKKTLCDNFMVELLFTATNCHQHQTFIFNPIQSGAIQSIQNILQQSVSLFKLNSNICIKHISLMISHKVMPPIHAQISLSSYIKSNEIIKWGICKKLNPTMHQCITIAAWDR